MIIFLSFDYGGDCICSGNEKDYKVPDWYTMSPPITPSTDCLVCVARNKMLFFRDPGPCKVCGGKYGAVGSVIA